MGFRGEVMATFVVYKTVEYVVECEVEADSAIEAIEFAQQDGDWEQIDGNEENYEAIRKDCCSHDAHENYCECCMSTCEKCKGVK
jgi:hypothetical protein